MCLCNEGICQDIIENLTMIKINFLACMRDCHSNLSCMDHANDDRIQPICSSYIQALFVLHPVCMYVSVNGGQ